MSVHAISWVLKFSETRLGERLVLLTLADHAKADGSCAWPSQETIAHEARLDERHVRKCLSSLERQGHIERSGASRFGTVIYTVKMPPGQIDLRANTTETASEMPPEPSVEPSSVEANASTHTRISGNPVHRESWELTTSVLAAFNERSGRKYRSLKSSGEPSEAAKYVYRRIREYPDLGFDDHVGIIDRTLASAWWGDGDASFNVVYGPKVFEENITRSASGNGKPKLKNTGDFSRFATGRKP